jgi:hypothetical protein
MYEMVWAFNHNGSWKMTKQQYYLTGSRHEIRSDGRWNSGKKKLYKHDILTDDVITDEESVVFGSV